MFLAGAASMARRGHSAWPPALHPCLAISLPAENPCQDRALWGTGGAVSLDTGPLSAGFQA